MMETFKLWWNARAPRERVLLAVMIALLAIVIAWLGVYRPMENGLRGAALANQEAADRYADMARKVEWLKGAEKRAAGSSSTLPVEQIIGQSAGEAGFTLDRVQAQGSDRVDIAIASARSTALLGWIQVLEGQGMAVDKAMITPSGTTGTVSAQISFRRSGAGS
ncbi:MAG: type II secretion system protein GspM [Sphingobium sp.]